MTNGFVATCITECDGKMPHATLCVEGWTPDGHSVSGVALDSEGLRHLISRLTHLLDALVFREVHWRPPAVEPVTVMVSTRK